MTEISLKVVNKYVPLKKKVVGRNQAPFLDKQIIKPINTKAGSDISFGKTQLWRTNVFTKTKRKDFFSLKKNA